MSGSVKGDRAREADVARKERGRKETASGRQYESIKVNAKIKVKMANGCEYRIM